MIKPGLMRFALAFLVILFHITKFVFLGHFAVLCFFILSGYWIAYMYDAKYSKAKDTLLPFYISRLWRLLPVYILLNFLAISVFTCYDGNLYEYTIQLPEIEKTFFWLSNIFILGFGFFSKQVLSPAWSLDIEVQFYLIFPAIFSTLVKLKKYLVSIFWIMLTLAAAISTLSPEAFLNKTALAYLPYFIIGSIIYLKKISFDKKTEYLFNILFIGLIAINYFSPVLRENTIYHHSSDYNKHLNNFLPLLLIPLISNSVRTQFKSKLDNTLGDMSYVLYLTHWVLYIPYTHYMLGASAITKLTLSASYLLATLMLSYFLYIWYDKPIDQLRRKWALAKTPLILA